MSKRVLCLYRVSTLGQVDPEDDIPMQRNECHAFIERQGWELTEEVLEKGVSGFKVSANDRDEITKIKNMALKDQFDVLLVYMFDRIGRRDDETPFLVQWFDRHGIEVWSVKEGQQKFENHVDKLTNYIRYWQASGESLKTSMRTRDGLAEAVLKGHFRGGVTPYGYNLVKSGVLGKKNREINVLELNPSEALNVKRMFELADHYGYGARKVAAVIDDEGIRNRDGEPFNFNTVRSILKNILYVGILKSGTTFSEPFEHLKIVEQDQYDRVNEIRQARAKEYDRKMAVPYKVQGTALLSGNIYCGHCGGRLTATSGSRNHHHDGGSERIALYRCYNHNKASKVQCNGPSTYRAERVDEIVDNLIIGVLHRSKKLNYNSIIKQRFDDKINSLDAAIKQTANEISKAKDELNGLDELLLPAAQGKIPMTPETLQRRIGRVEEKLKEQESQLGHLTDERQNTDQLLESVEKEYDRLISWAKLYSTSPLDVKKMIVSSMIEHVQVSRDYNLDVKLNLDMDQFMNGL